MPGILYYTARKFIYKIFIRFLHHGCNASLSCYGALPGLIQQLLMVISLLCSCILLLYYLQRCQCALSKHVNQVMSLFYSKRIFTAFRKTLVFSKSDQFTVYFSLFMSYYFSSHALPVYFSPIRLVAVPQVNIFFPTQGHLHMLSLHLEYSSPNFVCYHILFLQVSAMFPQRGHSTPFSLHSFYILSQHCEFFFRKLILTYISVFIFMILSLIYAS